MKLKFILLILWHNIFLPYEGYFPVKSKDKTKVEELHIANNIIDEMHAIKRTLQYDQPLELDVPSSVLHRICRFIVAIKKNNKSVIQEELLRMTKADLDNLSAGIEKLDIPLLHEFKYCPVRPFDTQKIAAEEIYLPRSAFENMYMLNDMLKDDLLSDKNTALRLQVSSSALHRVCRLIKSVQAREFAKVDRELQSLNDDEASEFIKAVNYLNVPILAERYGQATSCLEKSPKIRELLNKYAVGDEINKAACKHRNLIRLLIDTNEDQLNINKARLEPVEESIKLVAARKGTYREYFTAKKINVNERLTDSAHQNNIDDVQYYLLAGGNPNYITASDMTPLIWAARNKASGAAVMLLEAKADPNLQSNGQDTALCVSVKRGMRGLVLALLNKKTDPNQLGYTQEPPLTAAIRSNNNEIAQDLLHYGADANVGTPETFALSWAVLCGRQRLVDEMLNRGARTNVINSMGNTPLQLARRLSFTDIENSLVRYGATE